MTPLGQIPNVKLVAVSARQQNLRIHSLAHHVGSSPFAGEERIESEVPPEIVGEFLWAAFQFPLPQHLEGLVIHHENSAWTVPVRSPQRAHQNSVGTAMN